MSSWNQVDESLLQQMLARKQAFQAAAIAPVEAIVFALTPDSQTPLGKFPVKLQAMRKFMVKMLIDNADSIRDALAPFDSGVREARPSQGDVK
jgi:hypothetical protein